MRKLLSVFLTLSFILWAGNLMAATITVNTNQDPSAFNPGICSLRQAIQSANLAFAVGGCTAGDVGPDEIVFADPNQVFELTVPPAGNPDDNLSGDLDICSEIRITGAGPAQTIIRANFPPNTPDRVLHVINENQAFNCFPAPGNVGGQGVPPMLNLEGVTIENGLSIVPIGSPASGLIGGGGILNQSELLMMNVVVQNNSADNRNNTTGPDSARVRGGGILNDGFARIEMSIIQNNNVASLGTGADDGAKGGGIANIDTNQIFDQGECVGLGFITTNINNNSVNRGAGGGVSTENCFLLGLMSAVYDNQVTGEEDAGTGCTQENLGNGGGVHVFSSGSPPQNAQAVLSDSTISTNMAPRDGGGIHQCNEEMGPTEVSSVTIANNTADSDGSGNGEGGGVWTSGEGVTDQFAFQNTIIADNLAAVGPDCRPEDPGEFLTSFGFNLVRDPSDCTIMGAGVANDLPAGSDPMLGPLMNNGGKTLTHALILGSAAIDTANPAGCEATISNPIILNWDQRDDPFARVIAGTIGGTPRCDVGAYEFSPTEISTQKTAPGTAMLEEIFLYTISITNNGPGQANGVMILDPLPAEVDFVSFGNISQGTCNQAADVVSCDLGSLAVGATATVEINVEAVTPGTAFNEATVTTNETEPQMPNATTEISQDLFIEGSGLLPCSLQRGEVPAHIPYVLLIILGSILGGLLFQRASRRKLGSKE